MIITSKDGEQKRYVSFLSKLENNQRLSKEELKEFNGLRIKRMGGLI